MQKHNDAKVGVGVYDVIIIGSGAAGLAAGIYAGRYLMKTLVAVGEFGGETASAGVIWNYPGMPGVDGYEIMSAMKKQAKEMGAEMVEGKVKSIANENNCYTIKIGSLDYFAKTIIFANGARHRTLGVAGEAEFKNKGVHYCVTCDGPIYVGKRVAIVGGGDSAVKGVNLMTQYGSKIYLIVRGDKLKAEPINLEQMKKAGDKLEILYGTEIKEIVGKNKVEKIVLSKEYQGSKELAVDALFEQIGFQPDTKLPQSLGVGLDQWGYIAVSNMMATNVPGVFAAGDATSFFGSFKQTIVAAAQGSVAATSAYNYHKEHGELCEIHWKPRIKSGVVD